MTMFVYQQNSMSIYHHFYWLAVQLKLITKSLRFYNYFDTLICFLSIPLLKFKIIIIYYTLYQLSSSCAPPCLFSWSTDSKQKNRFLLFFISVSFWAIDQIRHENHNYYWVYFDKIGHKIKLTKLIRKTKELF